MTTKLLISVAMAASMTAWTTAPGTSISSSVSPGETSLSPDGNRVLAQWSGECEVPLAYLATLQSGPPVPITGATTDAPESFALGWTRGDRALVLLPEGSCGPGTWKPGVYAFDAPGSASLIATVPSTGLARMWGSR